MADINEVNGLPQSESISVQDVPQPKPVTEFSPEDAVAKLKSLDSVRDATRISNVLNLVSDQNPDRAAAVKKLSDQSGLPIDVVETNFDTVSKRQQIKDMNLDQLTAYNPVLSSKLADPTFAAISKDDTPNLSAIETSMKHLGNAFAAGVSFDPSAAFYGTIETAARNAEPLGELLAGSILPENPFQRVAQGAHEMRVNQQKHAEALAGMNPDAGLIERGITSGVRSVGQMAPGIVAAVSTGNPAFAIGSGMIQAGSNSATNALDKGLSPLNAALYGTADALAEGAGEYLPAVNLIKNLKASSPFWKTLASQIMTEVPSELLTTAVQDFNQWAYLNNDKPFSDYLSNLPMSEAETLIATLTSTLLMTGGAHAANKIAQSGDKQANKAAPNAQLIQAMMDHAKVSKTLQRDIGSAQAFFKDAKENNGLPNLFADAQTLHQTGLAEPLAQLLPDHAKDLADAILTGGVVSLPTDELLTKVAPTDLAAQLVPHLRTEPNGFSLNEAQDWMDSGKAQQLETDMARALGAHVSDAAFKESQEKLKQAFLDQLNQLNRFDPRKNESDATIYSSFAAVMAANLGMTPEAFHQEYGPGIYAQSLGETELNQKKPGSDIGHKREASSGRYVGAPEWVGNSPQKLSSLRTKLRDLAIEGEPGRYWYENSSKAILDLTGGNKKEAEDFVSLIAIYSPNSTVPANTTSALTALYQYRAGLPIKAGFGDANRKATELLKDGKVWSGIKTNSFYQNLMVEIDPSKLDEGTATMDMWMALAFDYGMKTLDQGPKYKFAEREIQRLGAELGWPAHQVQAAIWTAMKGRIDPIRKALTQKELKLGIAEKYEKDGKELIRIKPDKRKEHFRLAHKMGMEYDLKHEDIVASKYDFSDAIKERAAQISWEATPGETTGILPGIHDAPVSEKMKYLQAVAKVLNPEGKDLIAEMVGLPPGHTLFGYSAWQGKIGAGAQTFTSVPSEGSKNKKQVKGPARELLNLYSAIRGLVLSQEAVVWHTPVFDDSKKNHNGIQLITDRPLNEAEMQQLYQAIYDKFGTWEIAPGFIDSGARLLNFVKGLDNKAFQDGMVEVLNLLPDDFGGQIADVATYRSDGEYISNDWKENPHGEGYQAQIAAFGRPDLLARAAGLQSRVQAVNDEFARKYGWDRPISRLPERGSEPLREGDGRGIQTTYGRAQEGSTSLTGVHYSHAPRTELRGFYYGRGMKGAEAQRVQNSGDQRLSQRIHFYVDEGNGIKPEAGVGGHSHTVQLNNLYNVTEDPLGLKASIDAPQSEFFSKLESAAADTGFDGIYVPAAQGHQGVAVIIGDHSVPVSYQGTSSSNTPTGASAGIMDDGSRRISLLSRQIQEFEANQETIQKAAPSAKLVNGDLVFNKEDQAALAEFFPAAANAKPSIFYQGGDSLGAFSPKFNAIALFQNANLSTLQHELAHYFLHTYMATAVDLMQKPEHTVGEERILNDVKRVLDWFGIHGDLAQQVATWHSMSLEEQRPLHEMFAESYESYLMSGKAPSLELQGTFRILKAWMVSVYKSIKDFLTQNPSAGKLNPEIRGVFDRMLATNDQIEIAEHARAMMPLFDSAEEAGMSHEDYQRYQLMGIEGTQEAIEYLQAKSLQDMAVISKLHLKAYKAAIRDVAEKRREIQAEVTPEIMSQPIYKAWEFLTGKQKEGGVRFNEYELRASGYSQAEVELIKARRMTVKDGGEQSDVIADVLGFGSGADLIDQLLNAKPPKEAISDLTDQKMLERYGDISSPAALAKAADEAVHNEARSKFLVTEANALAKAIGKPSILFEAAKEYANNTISQLRLNNIRPDLYTAAEARASKAAEKARKKGDIATAAAEKRNQVLQNQLARAAIEARNDVEKLLRNWKQLVNKSDKKLSQGYDMSLLNAVRAILAEYGIAPRLAEKANNYLEVVKRIEPDLYEAIAPLVVEAQENAKPFLSLTVEELRGLRDTVDSILFLSKRAKEAMVDGKKVEIKALQESLMDQLKVYGIPETTPGTTSAITPQEQLKAQFMTLLASGKRMENAVDLWDKENKVGPFHRYVWLPIKEAADNYRLQKGQVLTQFKALFDGIAPSLSRSIIKADELNYTFGKDSGGSAINEILHAILHTGNESNKRKLLLGRGWATETPDGQLDTSRWDAFINRMAAEGKLTKEHMDFVQSVWDLLESLKPQAQQTYREVFGKYFDEITAKAVTTPFGVYRGGYVPAMVDSRMVKDAEMRKLVEDSNASMQFSFPSTNKGFTKSRVEYNMPLLLDIRSLLQHIDKVLLFTHMESPVRDVKRILDGDVIKTLTMIDPGINVGLVTPWLNRSARQQVETPIPGDAGMSRFLSAIRQRSGAALMFGNVVNTLQQLTGFSVAAIKVPASDLKKSFVDYIKSPKEVTDLVASMSPYMKNRMDSQVASMMGEINEILLNPTLIEKGRNWALRHQFFLQSALDNTMSPVIWMAAYNREIAAGQTDKDAIRVADSVVRETQGSQNPEEVSRIETGNAFVRWFTQFTGYFNAQANTLGTDFVKIMQQYGLRKGMGKGMYLLMLGFYVPAVISQALSTAGQGGADDEDKDGEYLDDWLRQCFLLGPLKYAAAMVPGAGQLLVAEVNMWNGKPYDDRIASSPAITMIESALHAPASVYNAATDQGTWKRAVRDVSSLISLTIGLPVNLLGRPIGYVVGVEEGKIKPENGLDYVRGIVTGQSRH